VISIRPATAGDADAMSAVLITSITELCVADHGNRPEALSRWLANKTPSGVRAWFANPDNRMFVAEEEDAIVAAGAFNLRREIILNYVTPAHRFAGVSGAMLAALEAALGPGEATLSSTGTALQFYRARGWVDAGAPEEWAGMKAYPMHKRLG
jgi:acetyltransferase (GNAT) family protein